MKRLIRTPQARRDALHIWLHVAEDSMSAADRLIDRFDEVLRHLVEHPQIGQSIAEIRPGLRVFPVGDYLLFYQEITDGIELFRIIHGARQWESLLGDVP